MTLCFGRMIVLQDTIAVQVASKHRIPVAAHQTVMLAARGFTTTVLLSQLDELVEHWRLEIIMAPVIGLGPKRYDLHAKLEQRSSMDREQLKDLTAWFAAWLVVQMYDLSTV